MEPIDDPVTTPCDHTFCTQCLDNWLQGGRTSCPLCRSALVTTGTVAFPQQPIPDLPGYQATEGWVRETFRLLFPGEDVRDQAHFGLVLRRIWMRLSHLLDQVIDPRLADLDYSIYRSFTLYRVPTSEIIQRAYYTISRMNYARAIEQVEQSIHELSRRQEGQGLF